MSSRSGVHGSGSDPLGDLSLTNVSICDGRLPFRLDLAEAVFEVVRRIVERPGVSNANDDHQARHSTFGVCRATLLGYDETGIPHVESGTAMRRDTPADHRQFNDRLRGRGAVRADLTRFGTNRRSQGSWTETVFWQRSLTPRPHSLPVHLHTFSRRTWAETRPERCKLDSYGRFCRRILDRAKPGRRHRPASFLRNECSWRPGWPPLGAKTRTQRFCRTVPTHHNSHGVSGRTRLLEGSRPTFTRPRSYRTNTHSGHAGRGRERKCAHKAILPNNPNAA